MHPRRHVATVIALILAPLALVAAANVAVDAAGVFGTPAVPGFSAYKPRQTLYAHAYKAAAYARDPRPTIFVGTSRVMYGLRPEAWQALGGPPAYNLGVGAIQLPDMRAWLAHARHHRPDLQAVVLGVEYLLFTALAHRTPSRVEPGRLARDLPPLRDWARHGLTFTALGDSWATLAGNRTTPDARAFTADGRSLDEDWVRALEQVGPRAQYRGGIRPAPPGNFARLRYDPATLAPLREMAAACRAAGIAFLVFVPPGHALEEEYLQLNGLAGEIEQWKRDLAAIGPYWDFTGYGPIQAEPLADRMEHYLDVVHFRPAVGDRILARLRGRPAAPAGFGRLVGPATVEAHLAALRAERAAWRATRPAGLELLRSLEPGGAGR